MLQQHLGRTRAGWGMPACFQGPKWAGDAGVPPGRSLGHRCCGHRQPDACLGRCHNPDRLGHLGYCRRDGPLLPGPSGYHLDMNGSPAIVERTASTLLHRV